MMIAGFDYKLIGGYWSPVVPVGFGLKKKGEFINTLCLIDSGAYMSLLNSQLGLALGVKITKGIPRTIVGVSGQTTAYQHRLWLRIKKRMIRIPVLFTNSLEVNIIGRWPFFDYFFIIFNQKKHKLWLVG